MTIQLKDPLKLCSLCWFEHETTEPELEEDTRTLVSARLVTIVKPGECHFCQLRRMLAGTGLEAYL